MAVTKNVKTDAVRVSLGNFLLGAVMVLIFALSGKISMDVIWGTLLGCSFVSLSFWWLSYALCRYTAHNPKTAENKVASTYTIRLLLTAAVVILAIRLPFINTLAAIVPLFYQRLVIIAVSRMRSRADKKEVVGSGN